MSATLLAGWIAAGLLSLAMAGLAVFALHALWLLWLFRRHAPAALAAERAEAASPLPAPSSLPRVVVQVPVFNERDVARRAILAAGALDWPRDRLLVQVLDDSTDDTRTVCAAAVRDLCGQGIHAEHRHRADREGFKASALAAGLAAADADFVAILDADFVVPPDFLKRGIRPLLNDAGLGFVQGRWEHVNARHNVITRAQAIGLDGHFAIEQAARAWSGLPMHFNGTCGIWRRAAIEAAGGWRADTLTEDVDLSYRAQLAGWRGTYRMDMAVPGELPQTVHAWRGQQFRWAKGSTQVARRLLPGIWRAGWPLRARLAATAHLTHYAVSLLIVTSLLAGPVALWLLETRPWWMLAPVAFAIAGGLGASLSVYVHSQRFLRRSRVRRLLGDLPVLVTLGSGLALSNGRGVAEALIGRISPFVRTPKSGGGSGSYRPVQWSGLPEWTAALWALWGHAQGISGLTPLLFLYASGFAWVAWLSTVGERSQAEPRKRISD